MRQEVAIDKCDTPFEASHRAPHADTSIALKKSTAAAKSPEKQKPRGGVVGVPASRGCFQRRRLKLYITPNPRVKKIGFFGRILLDILALEN